MSATRGRVAGSDDLMRAHAQWLGLKAAYPECVVFVFAGKRFATFRDDAHAAASAVGLPLEGLDGNTIPLIRSTRKAITGIVEALLARRMPVALATPDAEGQVGRETTRVYTPHQQDQQADKSPNRWLTTVKLVATWECVCGNHHQVNVLTDDDPICAACGRKWTLTLTPAGLDIHYDDPPTTTTRGPTLRQVSEAVR